MKRFFLVLGGIVCAFGILFTTAYAVDNGSVDPSSTSEGSEAMAGDENGDTGSSVLTSGSGDVPTVNVSDESINAIADAVSNDGSEGTLTLNNGVTITFPDGALEHWNAYANHLVWSDGAWYYCLLSDAPAEGSANGYAYINSVLYYMEWRTSGKSFSHYQREQAEVDISRIVWADYHIYDEDGNVLYTADVANAPDPTYTISFETGFDDLTFPSVSSDEFALPAVSYPGYTFEGWYLDSEYVYPYTSDYEFTSSTTLYAKWTKVPVVSFVTGFDDLTVEDQYANALSLPRLSHEGSVFVGWYLDPEYETPFVLGSSVTEDLTLYAKWTDDLPMSFFATSVFDSLTVITECQPIFYLISLCGMAIVLAVVKRFVDSRC